MEVVPYLSETLVGADEEEVYRGHQELSFHPVHLSALVSWNQVPKLMTEPSMIHHSMQPTVMRQVSDSCAGVCAG